MLVMEKLSRKAHEFSLESRQSWAALLGRQKFSVAQDDRAIVDDLNKTGVHITTLQHLFGDAAKAVMDDFALAAADLDIVDNNILPDYMQKKTSSIDLKPSVILARHPKLFLLFLSKRILNLVESYLGMSAAYHGVALRRSLIDGIEVGPRLWHKDAEDFHVVRIIVYLNDVTEGGGPFEYIPRSYGLTYDDLKGFKGRLTNENILKIVPQNVIRTCYGKAGTVIISDSANTFHHEKLQLTQQRSVAMFGFSSRLPRGLELAMRHFPVEDLKDQLAPLLSPQRLPYVYGWRR
jgi:hypothetical protein